MERLIDLVSNIGYWAYLVIFLAACLESAGFLGIGIPGETLSVLGGFLAAHGVLDLPPLLILVCVGAVIGDSIGYELGRRLGRSWLVRYGGRIGIREEHLRHVEEFFTSHGGKTVFLARFYPFLRMMVPFVAGAARFRYGQFLVYNVLGGMLWGTGVVSLGYLAGASWAVVHRWIGRAGTIVGGMLLVILLWAWLWRWLFRNEARLKRWGDALRARPAIAALRRRFGPLIAFLHARLTPGEYLGLELTVGVLVFVAAAGFFGVIVHHVVAGDPLTQVDRQVTAWLQAHSHPRLTLVLSSVNALGGPVAIVGVALVAAGYLVIRRKAYRLVSFLLVLVGGVLLNAILKLVFHYVRLHLDNPWTLLSGWGFPAGRANAAILLYGFLALDAIQSVAGWRRHVSIVLGTTLLIVLISFSGIYLGIQYLSSVLAGAVAGVAWMALGLAAMNTWRCGREYR